MRNGPATLLAVWAIGKEYIITGRLKKEPEATLNNQIQRGTAHGKIHLSLFLPCPFILWCFTASVYLSNRTSLLCSQWSLLCIFPRIAYQEAASYPRGLCKIQCDTKGGVTEEAETGGRDERRHLASRARKPEAALGLQEVILMNPSVSSPIVLSKDTSEPAREAVMASSPSSAKRSNGTSSIHNKNFKETVTNAFTRPNRGCNSVQEEQIQVHAYFMASGKKKKISFSKRLTSWLCPTSSERRPELTTCGQRPFTESHLPQHSPPGCCLSGLHLHKPGPTLQPASATEL
ncbi:hypothetical protein H920_06005 [Fukomys damarensis]|uniref:Uncharacterized protein n=1 Tax=Fukomys damarensis TaxID=885580 RepID=A0A091DKE3_FUKDA|nr:hypothetical protein H920_06005 [Fukomys damarensis]